VVLRASTCILAIVVSGCSTAMEIQTVARPHLRDLQAREPDCDLVIYEISEQIDPSCEEVGDVFVGDTGFTMDCGWDQVIDAVRREACTFGADAAQIVAHHEPSFTGSTCHQVRARLVVCSTGGLDGE
jgi:hypothetical protein